MIAVLDYGIGNLRSAEKALLAIGAPVKVVTCAEEARGAEGVILPGVGAFGSTLRALRSSGLDRVALGAISSGVPFFGICVGYQVLFEASEESVEERGLGVFDGTVRRLKGEVRLPQMQWNTLRATSCRSKMLPRSGRAEWMYFVHGFVPEPGPISSPSIVAMSNYGTEFPVAMERENVWGVQFHPEKSGGRGLALLRRFVSFCDETRSRLSVV